MNRIIIVLAVFIGLAANLSAKQSDIQKVKSASENWRSQQGLVILNDFRDLLSMPNVASNLQDMAKNADWIESYIEKRGFKFQRLEAGGAPYIYAELNQPGASKTVLIYAHFDGQPVNMSNWSSSPWQPQLRDNLVEAGGKDVSWPTAANQIKEHWRLFARSSGDDKAPVIALMAAIDALKSEGINRSVNIKLILDGEEEAGSPTLEKLLDKYAELLKADLMLFCDGPMHQSRQRQLVFGVRGTIGLNLTTYGPSRPLHSGHYGNWAPNAAEQMIAALDSIHDENGRIAIQDYYLDVRQMTEEEKRAISVMPEMDAQLKKDLVIAESRLKDTRVEEAIMQPAAVITGVEVGSTRDKARNVLVPQAHASINFRLVANQQPTKVRQLVENHFRQQGYYVINELASEKVRSQHSKVLSLMWEKSGYPAFRSSLESAEAIKLSNILSHLEGDKPLMTPTMGGSLPIYLFEKALNIPIIILPVANHDNNQHGPNENLRIKNLWEAIDVYAAVLAEFGK
ncbi:MAG: M20/M25/M40 family metallo-hydrolase [Gammaproteobacteria bacterium]|nr:M20/M25/M40 family metallo-hydrolase [Gammaproteobacteria bacterium]